jgi:hypothetical protein
MPLEVTWVQVPTRIYAMITLNFKKKKKSMYVEFSYFRIVFSREVPW